MLEFPRTALPERGKVLSMCPVRSVTYVSGRSLPPRPTCPGAGPLQVLKIRGFSGNSRQAGPLRPVYNANRLIAASKGTGIRTLGPPSEGQRFSRLPRPIRPVARARALGCYARDHGVFLACRGDFLEPWWAARVMSSLRLRWLTRFPRSREDHS
jgi:hypothetical protein